MMSARLPAGCYIETQKLCLIDKDLIGENHAKYKA